MNVFKVINVCGLSSVIGCPVQEHILAGTSILMLPPAGIFTWLLQRRPCLPSSHPLPSPRLSTRKSRPLSYLRPYSSNTSSSNSYCSAGRYNTRSAYSVGFWMDSRICFSYGRVSPQTYTGAGPAEHKQVTPRIWICPASSRTTANPTAAQISGGRHGLVSNAQKMAQNLLVLMFVFLNKMFACL